MSLTLAFFGGFQAIVHGQPAAFATDRARALLAYLAVEADQPHRREALATLLWADDLESAARGNLSQTLLRVRQAIGDQARDATAYESPFLMITRQTLQLKPTAPVTTDVGQFQHLLTTDNSRKHADPRLCAADCVRLEQAIDLYRGPFLAGAQLANSAPFEEWVLFTREQLQRQVLEALDRLARHYAATGNHEKVQQVAARQLLIEPWCEAAHRQLMTALALTGQRAAALAQYESCRRLLAEELAVAPDAETVVLMEQIRAGELDKVTGWQGDKVTVSHPFTLSPPHPVTLSPRDPYAILARLEPQPDQQLFGVAAAQTRLHALLQTAAAPWLLAIDGLGGIGKTTLATRLAHEFVHSDRFANLAWVTAKQEEFQPGAGIRATNHQAHGPQTAGRLALDADSLLDALVGQLLPSMALTTPRSEKRAALLRHLKTQPCLVVVDNLETLADSVALLPELRQLANPSKFLLTTRFSLTAEAGIFAYTLAGLSESEVLAFLRYEAETRNIVPLLAATTEQLTAIYRVVGGNPLALKLVIGQVAFLPLAQILHNLQQACGKRVDALYTYIYWQAWQLLVPDERQLFLTMPLVPNGTFTQVALVSGLDEDRLQGALARLIELSLVQVGGDLAEPRYGLHRLTETFLMHEVLKW